MVLLYRKVKYICSACKNTVFLETDHYDEVTIICNNCKINLRSCEDYIDTRKIFINNMYKRRYYKNWLTQKLRHYLKGELLSNRFKNVFGCSHAELKRWIESQFRIRMNWGNHGQWHIDHIIPCNSFNLENSEEIEICFHYTNLQPLWKKDNLVKKNVYIGDENVKYYIKRKIP